MRSYDVLVIGGGVAGASAALAAASAGARTALVRPSPGTTGITSGGWRGPLPDRIRTALAAAGLPHVESPIPLPHPGGRLASCDYAPESHARAAPADRTLVCGIAGLPGFHAPVLARLWGDAADATLHAATLHIEPEGPAAGWAPPALAAALDRDPSILAGPLARAVRSSGAERVVLPAVLGIDEFAAVRAALEDAAGVPVGEALGVPPSVPGWRLDRALLRALDDGGVDRISGRVAGREGGGRVEAVQVRDGSGDRDPDRVAAGAFVLASGKFAGGGIAAEEALAEPALGCPVWIDHLGERHTAPTPLALTAPERAAPQPLLRAGVRVDGRGRPVSPWGDVVYENVHVAGSVRAGCEAAALGLGDAAVDGLEAGAAAGGST